MILSSTTIWRSYMLRTLTNVITSLLLVYISVSIVLFLFQRSLIYFPQPRSNVSGTDLIELKTEGGITVNLTAINTTSSDAILYFGGNAEDVSYSISYLTKAFPGKAIYAMHYRGYGGSDGTPTEKALINDAFALYDSVNKQHKHIGIIGRSLGSGIAIQLASARQITKLVLVTPFDSLVRVASKHYPFLPVHWLLKDKYESWKYAASITVPTTIIAAEYDEMIPLERTQSLLTYFGQGVAQFNVVKDATHNTLGSSPEYVLFLRRAR